MKPINSTPPAIQTHHPVPTVPPEAPMAADAAHDAYPTVNISDWNRLIQPGTRGFATPAHLVNRGGPATINRVSSEQASEGAMANFFNAGISTLNGTPKAGRFSEKYVTQADTFFHWLYMRPGTSDYREHGFFIPKGSTLEMAIETTRDGSGWRRSISFNVNTPPDNFGMFGPISMNSTDAPVGESRISKIIFTQKLSDTGKVLDEKTEMGLVFADKSGKWRDPSFLEKRFWLNQKEKDGELRKEKINGKTLYVVDVTESLGGLWQLEARKLQQTLDIHEKRTGEKLEPGSVANRMAYFKFIFLLGLRSAASDGSDAKRVANARRRIGLD